MVASENKRKNNTFSVTGIVEHARLLPAGNFDCLEETGLPSRPLRLRPLKCDQAIKAMQFSKPEPLPGLLDKGEGFLQLRPEPAVSPAANDPGARSNGCAFDDEGPVLRADPSELGRRSPKIGKVLKGKSRNRHWARSVTFTSRIV
jgi:hypothetical protein